MTPEQITVYAAAIGGVAGVVALVWRVARSVWRFTRRISDFLDDWFGTEARPGVPARPGVMERLQRVEQEVTYNDGGSLKDAVLAIQRQLGINGR